MNEHATSSPDIEKATAQIENLLKNRSRPLLVALDGRSGTGKSTIAQKIVTRLGGVEILADDFWVGGSNEEWDQRTPQEKAEMAIDWKRIRREVLEPLLAGKTATWHPFDWNAGKGVSPYGISRESAPLIVLDGAYSTRPELQDIIDLSILVEVPEDEQRRARLVARESEDFMSDWHARWDVAEDYYFSKVRPKESFDLVIANH